jgi:hypothetical protein
MKRTKQEYQKLWEETEKYYSDKSKCAVNKKQNTCLYLDKNGNKCAVGRALNTNHPQYKKLSKLIASVEDITGKLKGVETLDELLYPRYRGYTLTFWKKLQAYHDSLALNQPIVKHRRAIKEYIRKLK